MLIAGVDENGSLVVSDRDIVRSLHGRDVPHSLQTVVQSVLKSGNKMINNTNIYPIEPDKLFRLRQSDA